MPLTARWPPVDARDRLREASSGRKRQASAGVDGEPWAREGTNLAAPLRDLSDRLQRGTDHAFPVERVEIPQAEGRQRRGHGRSATGDVLGVPPRCRTTRTGKGTGQRPTMAKRLRTQRQAGNAALRARRPPPLPPQGAWLCSVLLGHDRS
jgi:hypothetical protein